MLDFPHVVLSKVEFSILDAVPDERPGCLRCVAVVGSTKCLSAFNRACTSRYEAMKAHAFP